MTVNLLTQFPISIGSFISAAAPSPELALIIAGPILVPLMIFSGFFLNNGSIPDWLIWLNYLSWFKYSNELLNVNQWTGVTNITCSGSSGRQCFTTGAQILTSLQFSEVVTLLRIISQPFISRPPKKSYFSRLFRWIL